jgi:enterochelin esterase family protein
MHTGIERLHSSLVDANIGHVSYESPGTAHQWQKWRHDLKDFAPRLSQEGSSKP